MIIGCMISLSCHSSYSRLRKRLIHWTRYGSFRGHDYGESISLTTAAGHNVVRSDGYYLDQLCDVDNWNAAHGEHRGTYWGAFQGWAYYTPGEVHFSN